MAVKLLRGFGKPGWKTQLKRYLLTVETLKKRYAGERDTQRIPVKLTHGRELKELFAGSKIGLVFVTAFLERRSMLKYLNDISWETEAWFAESPTHLLHFNGERFLGPYED